MPVPRPAPLASASPLLARPADDATDGAGPGPCATGGTTGRNTGDIRRSPAPRPPARCPVPRTGASMPSNRSGRQRSGLPTMATMVPFTNNYSDRSTREGYQFEFFCQRCGNGYSSSFQHSVTGFGGRLLRLGGDLLGGEGGEKASQVGWGAEGVGGGNRGATPGQGLGQAAEGGPAHLEQGPRRGRWCVAQVLW